MKSDQKKRLSKAYTNENGYTLIIAIVIMVVLLIVGTAVITVAANSLNTVNRRVDSRQTYYVAKSVMNVIDRSMMKEDTTDESKRGLGQYLKEKAYENLSDKVGQEASSYNLALQSVDLEGMEGCSVKDMNISYKASLKSIDSGDLNKVAASLDLSDIAVSFTAVCGEQTYKIKATYTYHGIATHEINNSEIEWSGGTWINTSVSQ